MAAITLSSAKYNFSPLVELDTVKDARVEILLNRYREKFGLNKGPVPQDGSIWLGINVDGKLAIAVNVRLLNPQLLEVLNLCPVRGRKGVLAVYEALKRIKALIDNGIYAGVICHTLYANRPFIRALARSFDQDWAPAKFYPEPYALVYRYGEV